MLDESANEKVYITEAQTKVPISATGAITIENAEIAVLDSDVGSVESQKKYVTCIAVPLVAYKIYFFAILLLCLSSFFYLVLLYNYCRLDLTKDEAVSLSANHLQKLRLSFQLTTPIGHVFKPHQVCSFPILLQ